MFRGEGRPADPLRGRGQHGAFDVAGESDKIAGRAAQAARCEGLMKTVTLYSRKNCCLCHAALDVIEKVREQHAFEFRQVDIDHDMDPKDPRRSGFAIGVPVVEVDGQTAFEHEVDAAELAKLVSEAG